MIHLFLLPLIHLKVLYVEPTQNEHYSYSRSDALAFVEEAKRRIEHQLHVKIRLHKGVIRDPSFAFPIYPQGTYFAHRYRDRLEYLIQYTQKLYRTKKLIKRKKYFILYVTPSLLSDGSSTVQAVPLFGGVAQICGRISYVMGYSTNIYKKFLYAVYTTMHELGHNWGMSHSNAGIMYKDVLSKVTDGDEPRISYSSESKGEFTCF